MPTINLAQTAYQPPRPGGAPNVGNVEAAASGHSALAAIASGVVELAGLGAQMMLEHRKEQERTERAADIANGLIEGKTALARVRIENAERNRSPKEATDAVRKAADEFAVRWLRDSRNVRSNEAREELGIRIKALAAETEVEALSESLARERQLTEARWEKAANTAVATGDRTMLDAVKESQLAAGEDPELVNLEYEASRDALLQNRFKAELGNFLLTDPTAEQAKAFEARLDSPDYAEMSDLAKVRMKSAARDYQTEWKAAQNTRQEQIKEARTAELGGRYAAGDLTLDQVYVIAGEDAKMAEEWVGYVNARNKALAAPASEAQKAEAERTAARKMITLERMALEVEGGNMTFAERGRKTAEDALLAGEITDEEFRGYMGRFSTKPTEVKPTVHTDAIKAVLGRLDALVANEKDDEDLFMLPEGGKALTAEQRRGLRIGDAPATGSMFKGAAKLSKSDVAILKRDVENFLTEKPNATSREVETMIEDILFPVETNVARARLSDRRAELLTTRRRSAPELGGRQ